MTNWTQKILAHLHDPPEKAFDFGKWHRARAEHYALRLGFSTDLWGEKSPDWTAAAADRFIFPDACRVKNLGQGLTFRHPLSGEMVSLPWPADQDQAALLLDLGFPGYEGDLTEAERFFLLWRCWLPAAASQKGAGAVPFLPADTRIPDGTIWNHNDVVSALEGTRNGAGELAPALLLFQLGPVQDFIAQARSTRDLWSGSYLLSWLIAHGLKQLAADLGPDSVVFPALRGQPLFDWLHRDLLDRAMFRQAESESKSFWEVLGLRDRAEDALVPGLPNRFLAIVPADYDPGRVEKAVQAEWKRIGDACKSWFAKQLALPEGTDEAWEFQLAHFLQLSWQLSPWEDPSHVRELVQQTGSPAAQIVAAMVSAAQAIPDADKDGRCYPLNQGVYWNLHYELTQHRLDARRACRDFDAWESKYAARDKDAFSGKEEALVSGDWLDRARKVHALKYLFRGREKLGAVNLVKRSWHLAWLDAKHGLKRTKTSFDSVYAVAVGSWKARLASRLHDDEATWHAFIEFAEKAHDATDSQEAMDQVPRPPLRQAKGNELEWLDKLDAELLSQTGWPQAEGLSSEQRQAANRASDALTDLLKKAKLPEPTDYYGVIALDGDRIGEWLSGRHNPPVGSLLSDKAAAYFGGFGEGASWLKQPRPVSPSFHLGFSEALSNFGLYVARRVIEAHHGQLIYSGGDDVLAMVPAEEAVACVEALRLGFRGDPALAERCPGRFSVPPHPGTVVLAGAEEEGLPGWPLLVPGPRMTVSAGISIGHVKAPLQDMIDEARAAERRAKQPAGHGGFNRNALAVSLVKRSGEIIHWGTSFDGHGLPLLAMFQKLHRGGALPSRFGHRLPELVARLDPHRLAIVTEELKPVLLAELDWAWNQLEGGDPARREAARAEFFGTAMKFLDELTADGAPVSRFADLFAVETFLKRQSV